MINCIPSYLKVKNSIFYNNLNNLPVFLIQRKNNKLLKDTSGIILFDKPTDWYSFHGSENERVAEVKDKLYNLISSKDLVPHKRNVIYTRQDLLSFLQDNCASFKNLAETYSFRYIFYVTKVVVQFIGIKFEDKNKELLFRLKTPLKDYRYYETSYV